MSWSCNDLSLYLACCFAFPKISKILGEIFPRKDCYLRVQCLSKLKKKKVVFSPVCLCFMFFCFYYLLFAMHIFNRWARVMSAGDWTGLSCGRGRRCCSPRYKNPSLQQGCERLLTTQGLQKGSRTGSHQRVVSQGMHNQDQPKSLRN